MKDLCQTSWERAEMEAKESEAAAFDDAMDVSPTRAHETKTETPSRRAVRRWHRSPGLDPRDMPEFRFGEAQRLSSTEAFTGRERR